MLPKVMFEMDLILLFIFSAVIPIGIYIFLYQRIAISRWTVLAFALLLVAIAGGDVLLLQALAEKAKDSPPLAHEQLFSGQLSLLLYLLPAIFAGLGINLVSHVLINHLNQAEANFDRLSQDCDSAPAPCVASAGVLAAPARSATLSEKWILFGSAVMDAIIFACDLNTGVDIRLHGLYIFPLALIARQCAAQRMVFTALVVTTVLQVMTFAILASEMNNFITDVMVSFAASLLIVFLARQARAR